MNQEHRDLITETQAGVRQLPKRRLVDATLDWIQETLRAFRRQERELAPVVSFDQRARLRRTLEAGRIPIIPAGAPLDHWGTDDPDVRAHLRRTLSPQAGREYLLHEGWVPSTNLNIPDPDDAA